MTRTLTATGALLLSAAFTAAELPPCLPSCSNGDLIAVNLRDTHLYRADLRNALLAFADFRGADLRGADLRNADLFAAKLGNSRLNAADLRNSHMHAADLRGADLSDATVTHAYLFRAVLTRAVLYLADLRHAHLHAADLSGANLRGANLEGAFLLNANLEGADLTNANLRNVRGCDLTGRLPGCMPTTIRHQPASPAKERPVTHDLVVVEPAPQQDLAVGIAAADHPATDDAADSHYGGLRVVLAAFAERVWQWMHTLAVTIAGWTDQLSEVYAALVSEEGGQHRRARPLSGP